MNRDLIYLLLGRLTQALISLALLKVMTNVLPKTEVGAVYVVIAFASAFGIIFVNPVSYWIHRNILSWRAIYSWRSILFQFGKFAFIGLGVALILSIVITRWAPGNAVDLPTLAVGLVCGIFGQFIYYTLSTIYNIVGSRKKYGTLIAVGQLIIFAATTLSIFLSVHSALVWLAFSFLGFFLASILFSVCINEHITGTAPAHFSKLLDRSEFRGFILPFIASSLAIWLQTQGYRVLLSYLADPEVLALFAVGFGISNNVGSIHESLIQQSFGPILLQAKIENDASAIVDIWQTMFVKVIMVLIVIFTAVVCASPIVVKFLTNPTYSAASRFLKWGILFEFFRILFSFANYYFFVQNRVSKALPAALYGALFSLSCFLVAFIKRDFSEFFLIFGLIGGAVVSLGYLIRAIVPEIKLSWGLRKIGISILLASPYLLIFLLSDNAATYLLLIVCLCALLYTGLSILILKRVFDKGLFI